MMSVIAVPFVMFEAKCSSKQNVSSSFQN